MTENNLYSNDDFNPSTVIIRQENERKTIRKIGMVSGFCILGYLALQNIISIPISMEPLYSIYKENLTFQSCINIILSIVGLLVPFIIGGDYLKMHTGTEYMLFQKPKSKMLVASASCLGMFICLIGNYLTSWIVTFAELGGIKLTSPEYDIPSDIAGRLIYVLSIAIVPPMIEELAVRGTIMQSLRKYGDGFAIVVSSLAFAILHGNLVQAPFAFIAGLGLGYAVCITDSLWTGMIIHCLNNTYSVIVEFMVEDITNSKELEKAYMLSLMIAYVISIAGSALFFMVKKKRKLNKSSTYLPIGRKVAAFIFNIPMLLAIIAMMVITANYIELT